MPPLQRLRWRKVRCFKQGESAAGRYSNALRYVAHPPDARLINVPPFLVLEPSLPAGWTLWQCNGEPQPGEPTYGQVVRGFDSLRHAKDGTRKLLLAVPDPRELAIDKAAERGAARRARVARRAGRIQKRLDALLASPPLQRCPHSNVVGECPECM